MEVVEGRFDATNQEAVDHEIIALLTKKVSTARNVALLINKLPIAKKLTFLTKS